jgi:Flavinator of succinate dehydrogenase
MTHNQLLQYDLFLDENDWDIYYWATQEPPPTSMEYAEGSSPAQATPTAQGKELKDGDKYEPKPAAGEWAQTIGAFKPAYRPIPSRWKDSEILAMLKEHVKARSAGGVHDVPAGVEGKGLNQSVRGTGGGGLGFMPPLRNFDTHE